MELSAKDVVGPIVGALIALAGIFLNHFLSRNKTITEKTWEKRGQIYSELTSLLNNAQTKFSVLLSFVEDEESHSYDNADLIRQSEIANDVLRDALDVEFKNNLFMSRKFTELFRRLAQDMFKDYEKNGQAQRDYRVKDALDRHLPQLIELAQKEIRR